MATVTMEDGRKIFVPNTQGLPDEEVMARALRLSQMSDREMNARIHAENSWDPIEKAMVPFWWGGNHVIAAATGMNPDTVDKIGEWLPGVGIRDATSLATQAVAGAGGKLLKAVPGVGKLFTPSTAIGPALAKGAGRIGLNTGVGAAVEGAKAASAGEPMVPALESGAARGALTQGGTEVATALTHAARNVLWDQSAPIRDKLSSFVRTVGGFPIADGDDLIRVSGTKSSKVTDLKTWASQQRQTEMDKLVEGLDTAAGKTPNALTPQQEALSTFKKQPVTGPPGMTGFEPKAYENELPTIWKASNTPKGEGLTSRNIFQTVEDLGKTIYEGGHARPRTVDEQKIYGAARAELNKYLLDKDPTGKLLALYRSSNDLYSGRMKLADFLAEANSGAQPMSQKALHDAYVKFHGELAKNPMTSSSMGDLESIIQRGGTMSEVDKARRSIFGIPPPPYVAGNHQLPWQAQLGIAGSMGAPARAITAPNLMDQGTLRDPFARQ